jgi:hypothetical protein
MDHQGHQGHQGKKIKTITLIKAIKVKIIAIKIISSRHPRDLRRNFPTPFHLFP